MNSNVHYLLILYEQQLLSAYIKSMSLEARFRRCWFIQKCPNFKELGICLSTVVRISLDSITWEINNNHLFLS
jgi:hypothetical protein